MIFRSEIRVESPLAISLRRATGNDIDTRLAVSGTVVRGALAQDCIDMGIAPDSEEFRNFFLNGLVRFGEHRLEFRNPWPLSVRRCLDDPEGHPIMDMLLLTASEAPVGFFCTAEGCGSKREHPHGFYVESMNGYKDANVRTRRIAHTAIDPRYLRAESGQFHSSRVICEGQLFGGSIDARGSAESLLQSMVGESKVLYGGRGRSRGQGRLRLTMTAYGPPDADSILSRLERLNDKARQYPKLRDKVLFSATLQSAAILFDEWLLPRFHLEASDILPQTHGYELLGRFHRGENLAGWSAAAGLPKSGTSAVAAGSCFLFGKPIEESTRAAAYVEVGRMLATAEAEGVGERREEGFGELTFCDEIHSQTAARA